MSSLPTSLFEKHKGHRAYIVDARTIKCVDCSHTLLIPQPVVADKDRIRPLPKADLPPIPPPGTYERGAPRAREALRRAAAERRAAAVAAAEQQEQVAS